MLRICGAFKRVLAEANRSALRAKIVSRIQKVSATALAYGAEEKRGRMAIKYEQLNAKERSALATLKRLSWSVLEMARSLGDIGARWRAN